MRQDKLVLIAGSAGSLQVILAVLMAMGRQYPIPVLVVLHRNNVFESSLEELLSTRTNLVIKEVEEKEPIVPGVVYLCPADYHVLVEKDLTFSLDYSERVNYSRPSIDVTMRSAADVYGEGLIALLLSGGNADGSDGMEYVQYQGRTHDGTGPGNGRGALYAAAGDPPDRGRSYRADGRTARADEGFMDAATGS